ncbi:MAG: hypothetical protein JWN40_904 [Phycisphaerales bacterium]|nr:hypothetical protein [Phycisphaerales bacterium]
MMRYALTLLIAAFMLTPARAASPAATQAAPDEIKRLIDQLGDGEYPKREEAAKRLKTIGKPAVPALKDAIANNEDAEIVSRSQALLKRIEIRPLPGADTVNANGMVLIQATRMRISVNNNGGRVLNVTEGGRDIQITDGPDGIVMSVTGLVDGQRVTEEYTARDLDELKADNPPAAELYQRWGLGGANGMLRGVRIGGGGVVQFNQINQLNLQPIVPDELVQLRASLDKQMRDAKVKEADRDEVNKGLEKLAEARRAGGIAAGMDKYSDQCDEFRKTLEQYKLEPGEFLPPPAKTRLGVSITTEGTAMFVQRVGDKSRAERIGLKPGDQIRKIDGKDVSNIGELRKAASAKEKGLIIEINRDGAALKLEEKEANEDAAK